MTHFQDGVNIGAAGMPQQSRSLPNLLPGASLGVPMSSRVVYDVVPAAIVANCLVTSAIVNGAATLTAGTSTTTTTISGNTVIKLDVPRCISITGTAGGVTAVPFTIVGYDLYGQPMTEVITGPAATATVTTLKSFAYVRSITSTGTTTAAVTVGTSDTLGLPYRVDSFGYVNIFYNTAWVTANTGFTAAVTTDPATTTTGDVRGKYALQSASDGVKRFVAYIYVADVDTMKGAYGVLPV